MSTVNLKVTNIPRHLNNDSFSLTFMRQEGCLGAKLTTNSLGEPIGYLEFTNLQTAGEVLKHYNGWQGWGLHGLSIELISYNSTAHKNNDDNDNDNERFKSHMKKELKKEDSINQRSATDAYRMNQANNFNLTQIQNLNGHNLQNFTAMPSSMQMPIIALNNNNNNNNNNAIQSLGNAMMLSQAQPPLLNLNNALYNIPSNTHNLALANVQPTNQFNSLDNSQQNVMNYIQQPNNNNNNNTQQQQLQQQQQVLTANHLVSNNFASNVPQYVNQPTISNTYEISQNKILENYDRNEENRKTYSHLPTDANRTLFVDNLPLDMTRRELAHIFRRFSGYQKTRLLRRESTRIEGKVFLMGFVDFVNPEKATYAMEIVHGYPLDLEEKNTAQLKISYARPLNSAKLMNNNNNKDNAIKKKYPRRRDSPLNDRLTHNDNYKRRKH